MAERIATLHVQEWPEIIDENSVADLPSFPTEALPSWLARYVREQSRAAQVPEDMTGMLALASVSAALQGRVNGIAANGNWSEPVTLYVALVMAPGERKSSIFDRVTKPLLEWEEEVQEREWPLVSASLAEREHLEDLCETLRKKVAKQASTLRDLQANEIAAPDTVRAAMADLDTLKQEHVDAVVALQRHQTRYKLRLLYNDLTPEACAQALSQQRYGFAAVMSSEGGVFEVLTGSRYSERLNLDVFLKSHSGDYIQIDRVGRDSETIMRPVLTLGVAVQPSVLTAIGKSKIMHSRGLTGRFAYSIPDSLMGGREISPATMSAEIAHAYSVGLKAVAEDAYRRSELYSVFLTDEADAAFVAFQEQLEPRLSPDAGDLSVIPEWAGKFSGLILRLAVIRSAARFQRMPEQVDLEDVEAAIEFAPYFEAHAMRAFSMMGTMPNASLERKIIARVKRDGIVDFKTSDLIHKIYAARSLATEDLEEVLEGLAKMGYIRRITTQVKPPRWHWAVNPAVHQQ